MAAASSPQEARLRAEQLAEARPPAMADALLADSDRNSLYLRSTGTLEAARETAWPALSDRTASSAAAAAAEAATAADATPASQWNISAAQSNITRAATSWSFSTGVSGSVVLASTPRFLRSYERTAWPSPPGVAVSAAPARYSEILRFAPRRTPAASSRTFCLAALTSSAAVPRASAGGRCHISNPASLSEKSDASE